MHNRSELFDFDFDVDTLFKLTFWLMGLFVSGVIAYTVYASTAGVAKVRNHAETYALEYMRVFRGAQNPTVQCMGIDSDNNGYVTCTAITSMGSTPEQIECTANLFIETNHGCREYRLRTVNLNGNALER